MGPFFGVLHSAGVPGWVAERLWWAVLLSVAFLGLIALARVLEIGTPFSRMLGGVAYACSPHVLTLLGANSIEALPMCLAPWVLVPLVRGAADGRVRRAGLLCGVAVLCMGGVNAAADLAALLPVFLWIVVRRPGLRLTAWAAGGVVLATAWWVAPLALLGKYSPPFLDYIEDARTTTSVTSLSETLRGTADWVAYLPWSGWQAGYQLLTEPVLVADTMIVAAIGLAGLAVSRSPSRLWLVVCLGAGLVGVTFGHGASVGALFSGAERSLLDTSLAPVRNVHKFDLLIRMPLVLGLADLLPRLSWGVGMERRLTATAARVAVVAALVGTATPMISLQLADADSYSSIPAYWTQTSRWLDAHAGTARSLLVPASTTPDYVWGTPTDEPLQALDTRSWDVRNNLPLTTAGHVRVLDRVDAMLASGQAQPALASYLVRAGIRYLVVRNDLDYVAAGSVAPGVVLATLQSSPGVRPVRSFGPTVGNIGDYSYSVDQGLQPPRPAVQVWRVDTAAAATATATATGESRVETAPASSLAELSGGPESISQLASDGVSVPPVVLAGQSAGGLAPSSVVLTDGLRRREVSYGSASGQWSTTLAAGQDGPIGRRVMDYLPVAGTTHQSVVRYLGARSVTASSSGADAGGLFPVSPDQQPWSAFDDDPSSVWRNAPGTSAVGQWVQVRLDHAVDPRSVQVRLPSSSPVRRVTIATGSSSHTYPVPASGLVTAHLSGASFRTLRVTVSAVAAGFISQVGIASVDIPGAHLARTVVLPTDGPPGRPVDVIDLSSPGDARTGCLVVDSAPRCLAGRSRQSEDGVTLDRTLVLPESGDYVPGVTVQPRAGAALDALLDQVAENPVSASASSQSVPDPLGGPESLVDDDPATGWVADPDDPDPSVTLTWKTPVTLDRLHFVSSPDLAATRPDQMSLTSGAEQRDAAIDGQGQASFPAVTTDRITIHLHSDLGLRRIVDSTLQQQHVGIGLTGIEFPGRPSDSRKGTADIPVTVPCGSGPTLTVDGVVWSTSVSTTVGAMRALSPATAEVCGTSTLTVRAGQHRLVLGATPTWVAGSLLLTRVGVEPAAAGSTPTTAVRVDRWGATRREVALGRRVAPTLLLVNENANPGWHASLGGRRLTSLTIDGWRQGYVVPSGAAGAVVLTYAPQHEYAVGLVVGAGAALLLLVLALAACVPWPRSRVRATQEPTLESRVVDVRRSRSTRAGALVLAALTCTLLGGWAGAVAALTTGVILLCWPSAGIDVGRGRRLRAGLVTALVAGGTVVVAGLVLAVEHDGTSHYAAGTVLLQVLCLVGIAAAVIGGDTA